MGIQRSKATPRTSSQALRRFRAAARRGVILRLAGGMAHGASATAATATALHGRPPRCNGHLCAAEKLGQVWRVLDGGVLLQDMLWLQSCLRQDRSSRRAARQKRVQHIVVIWQGYKVIRHLNTLPQALAYVQWSTRTINHAKNVVSALFPCHYCACRTVARRSLCESPCPGACCPVSRVYNLA
eukprot:COSAG01_NODE_12307_length_1763_cov_0.963341_2_plen_184_part_00